jgi:integrase
MEAATYKAYLKLATHFYKERIAGDVTPKKITDALLKCADEYRPAYWRKLRNALELDQRHKGYEKAADRIKEAKNPLTVANAPIMIKLKIKKKEHRVKSVKDADHQNIIAHFEKNNDIAVVSALKLARLTGCRPAEMSGIEILADSIVIKGAKKSAELERGLDRTLLFDKAELDEIKRCVQCIKNEYSSDFKTKSMKRIQARLEKGVKALYPKRSARITLYSYRHQTGSNLKASGLDRVTVAYLMGHQSTKSVEVYGNRRSASGSTLLRPEPAALEQARGIIRDNHRDGPKEKTRQLSRAPRTNDLSYSS